MQQAKKVSREQEFAHARQNIPLADIAFVRKQGMEESSYPDMFIASLLVTRRWNNPVCDQCSQKEGKTKFKRCALCLINVYCSKECQTKHWLLHKLRCQKTAGPLDETGPQRLLSKTSILSESDGLLAQAKELKFLDLKATNRFEK